MEKDLYFKDEASKFIFFLIEVNGKTQMDLLKMDRILYFSKDAAKNWYEFIKNKIKNSNHPKLNEAIQSLEKLYKGMTR